MILCRVHTNLKGFHSVVFIETQFEMKHFVRKNNFLQSTPYLLTYRFQKDKSASSD